MIIINTLWINVVKVGSQSWTLWTDNKVNIITGADCYHVGFFLSNDMQMQARFVLGFNNSDWFVMGELLHDPWGTFAKLWNLCFKIYLFLAMRIWFDREPP